MAAEGRRASVAAALALLLAAAGCRSPLSVKRSELDLRAEGGWVLVEGLDVPAARRGPAGCGAQALATVLGRSGAAGSAQVLADALPWQDAGATPVDLLLEARRRGAEATIARGTWDALADGLRRGEPALVMIDAAPEVRVLFTSVRLHRLMHWSVASGMDRGGTRLLLADRHHRHAVLRREDFQQRWDQSDCCMILVRPAGAGAGAIGRGASPGEAEPAAGPGPSAGPSTFAPPTPD